LRRRPSSTLFPYTTLFRSAHDARGRRPRLGARAQGRPGRPRAAGRDRGGGHDRRAAPDLDDLRRRGLVGLPPDVARTGQVIALGQRAPLVRLTDTRGTPADVGAPGGPALVVFLPAAFTPVCSGELAGLRRVLPRVREAGAEVLAVACDSMFALRTWAEQEGLGEEPGLRVLSDR